MNLGGYWGDRKGQPRMAGVPAQGVGNVRISPKRKSRPRRGAAFNQTFARTLKPAGF